MSTFDMSFVMSRPQNVKADCAHFDCEQYRNSSSLKNLSHQFRGDITHIKIDYTAVPTEYVVPICV